MPPLILDGEPIFEPNGQLVQDTRPVVDRHRPFARDVPVDQEQQLARGLCARKCPFRFGDLPQLPVVALHTVGGVDQAPNIGWIVKHRRQVVPIGLPRTHRNGVLRAPLLAQFQEIGFGCFPCWCLVDRSEIRHKRLPVLPGDIAQAVPDLMDHAALNMGGRKDCLDRRFEARQSVNTGDKDVLHPTGLQIGHD